MPQAESEEDEIPSKTPIVNFTNITLFIKILAKFFNFGGHQRKKIKINS